MRRYVGASRIMAALVLACLVWYDLPAPITRAIQVEDTTVAPERPATVTARGGARSLPAPSADRDILTARLLAISPTHTPSPQPRPPEPTQTPDPQPLLKPLGQFKVTAYSDSPYLNGTDGRGITRSGQRTRWGVVAVDPRVIPLGTTLMIEGIEGTLFEALDTGGGVLGRWVDVWFPTDWQAIQHGVRYLNVYAVVR